MTFLCSSMALGVGCSKKLIDESGLEVESVILLQEAADKVAEAVA